MIVGSRVLESLTSMMSGTGEPRRSESSRRDSFKQDSSNPTTPNKFSNLHLNDPFADIEPRPSVGTRNSVESSELLSRVPEAFEDSDSIYSLPSLTESKGQLDTVAVHGGERRGAPRAADALSLPVVNSSTYTFQNTEQIIACRKGLFESFGWGLQGNPTSLVAEEKIRLLENAENCLLSQNGNSNNPNTLLVYILQALVPRGGHIILMRECNRGVQALIDDFLPNVLDITATIIDPNSPEGMNEVKSSQKVDLFYVQSPSNLTLRCIDIAKIASLCKRNSTLLVVDNTFATPIAQQPLKLGADLVIHSTVEFLCGHSNAMAGAICGSNDLVNKIKGISTIYGGILDAQSASNLINGLQTLDVRMQKQQKNALEIAKRLEQHPKVACVHYPGLESHPDYEEASDQMTGYGSVVNFEVAANSVETSKFIDNLRIPYIANSQGGVQSTIQQPSILTYGDVDATSRRQDGIRDNLVVYSIGLENVEDLWKDVEYALSKTL